MPILFTGVLALFRLFPPFLVCTHRLRSIGVISGFAAVYSIYFLAKDFFRFSFLIYFWDVYDTSVLICSSNWEGRGWFCCLFNGGGGGVICIKVGNDKRKE